VRQAHWGKNVQKPNAMTIETPASYWNEGVEEV
jgi:hypothetical protein